MIIFGWKFSKRLMWYIWAIGVMIIVSYLAISFYYYITPQEEQFNLPVIHFVEDRLN
jgi:hypothetical protein